jgi:hypothetical protein
MRQWRTSEDECKWFIAIWFILLKQSKIRQWDIWIWCHGTLLLFTYKMVIIHSNYVLCARWVLFVMLDSSSHLPCCSMRVLPPPLLILFPAWRAGPSPIPPTWVDPISLRVQALSCFSIGYSNILNRDLTYLTQVCAAMSSIADINERSREWVANSQHGGPLWHTWAAQDYSADGITLAHYGINYSMCQIPVVFVLNTVQSMKNTRR